MPIPGLTFAGALSLGASVAKVRFDPSRRRLLALMAEGGAIRGLRYSEDHDLEEAYRVDTGDVPVADVAYSTGYDWFVTVGMGRSTDRWDPSEARRKPDRVLPQKDQTAVALTRKTKVLLLGGARRVVGVEAFEGRPWGGDVRTSGRVVVLSVHPEDRAVLCVATAEQESHVFFGRVTIVDRTPGLVQHDVRYRAAFPVHGAAFAPDGRSFALVGGVDALQIEVVAFPAMRTRLRWRASGPAQPGAARVESVGFDDAGTHVWVGTPAGQLLSVDVGSGDVVGEIDAHGAPITTVDVRHGRRLAVTAAADGTVKLWKMPELPRRPYDPDAPKHPVTEEFKGWHAPWTRGDVEGMRTFEPPAGMPLVGG